MTRAFLVALHIIILLGWIAHICCSVGAVTGVLVVCGGGGGTGCGIGCGTGCGGTGGGVIY